MREGEFFFFFFFFLARLPPPPFSSPFSSCQNLALRSAWGPGRKTHRARRPLPPPSDRTPSLTFGSPQVIYLITEEVTPLLPTLASLGMDRAAASEFAAGGVHAIAKALAFLAHDAGGLALGGLAGASAVGLTPTLEWRLVGLDFLAPVAEAGVPGCPLAASPRYLPRQFLAPEVARGEWEAVAGGPAWAPDAWGLGGLMAEAFSREPLASLDGLRSAAASLPPPVTKAYQRLLATAPARRLDPRALVASGALHTPAVKALEALEGLALADATSKASFFSATLPAALPRFPPALAQRRLLPALGQALEYGGAPPSALAPLLAVAATLDDAAWGASALPLLARLARSPDRGLRLAMLEAVPAFGPRLPPSSVEADFYPAFESGFGDATPHLRDATLKAMATLGPSLSPRTLSHSLLKHLAKLQVDEAPGIRANTTLLLGALAPRLDPAARGRVLMNALARALRDPWPPARAAGARALKATLDLHPPGDLAARGLPAVGPGIVDGDKDARAAALDAATAILQRLKAHAAELDEKDAAAAAAAAAAGGGANARAGGYNGSNAHGNSSSVNATGSGGGGGGGGGGWGLSIPSISSLASSALGGGQAAPPPANGGSAASASASARPAPPAPQPPRPRPVAAFGGSNTGSGGWNDEEEEEEEDDPAEAAARARLSGLGLSSSRPAAAPGGASQVAGDDDDGWEDMDAPAPPPRRLPAPAAGRPPALVARPVVGMARGRGGLAAMGRGIGGSSAGLRLGGRGAGGGGAPAFEL